MIVSDATILITPYKYRWV